MSLWCFGIYTFACPSIISQYCKHFRLKYSVLSWYQVYFYYAYTSSPGNFYPKWHPFSIFGMMMSCPFSKEIDGSALSTIYNIGSLQTNFCCNTTKCYRFQYSIWLQSITPLNLSTDVVRTNSFVDVFQSLQKWSVGLIFLFYKANVCTCLCLPLNRNLFKHE